MNGTHGSAMLVAAVGGAVRRERVLGSLTLQMVFAAGGASLSRYISRPSRIRAINLASGPAIAAFGIAGLIEHAA